jgi:hypothetical protein
MMRLIADKFLTVVVAVICTYALVLGYSVLMGWQLADFLPDHVSALFFAAGLLLAIRYDDFPDEMVLPLIKNAFVDDNVVRRFVVDLSRSREEANG